MPAPCRVVSRTTAAEPARAAVSRRRYPGMLQLCLPAPRSVSLAPWTRSTLEFLFPGWIIVRRRCTLPRVEADPPPPPPQCRCR